MVVRALAAGEGPKSVIEIHRRVRGKVPLSSLYRTLAVLEEAGVVARHHSSGGVTRYELSDWVQGHHHHLLCKECGAVDDTDLPESIEQDIRDLVKRIGARSGFTPSDHMLEIQGLCTRCR
jgi:Fur family ferric uptake transcriptional regulator